MAPDFERLARRPCPIASWASSGIKFSLGILVLEKCRSGLAKHDSEFRPGIGGGHVDHTHRLDPWPSRHGKEQARGFAALDTAPEFPLGGDDEVLVEGIGVGGDLDPFAPASDHGQNG